ncbi:MAG: glycosyltransferase family 4 protein, partial [Acidimicrobiales bacterium]
MDTRPLPPKRPRLLHVTTADISLALLLGPQLAAFADAGYEVMGASAGGPFVADLLAEDIGHFPLRHCTRAVSPLDDIRAPGELYRLFRSLRPDIVHTHNPKPGIYGRPAARAARVPAVVNTVHGLYATPDDPWSRRAAVYGLERMAAACSDAELVQSSEDLETLVRLGVPRSRLRLLGNGIDLSRFDPGRVGPEVRARERAALGVGPDAVVIGAVGRLVWEKGYAELFAAARMLRTIAPGAVVVVTGPSDPAKADGLGPRDLARAEADGVRVLGFRPDVEGCYAAMDGYVLASHREGFPRSAMEAAAMGLPVVATDIRGCRQVVDDGVTGFLVPARDPERLSSALARLAVDPG